MNGYETFQQQHHHTQAPPAMGYDAPYPPSSQDDDTIKLVVQLAKLNELSGGDFSTSDSSSQLYQQSAAGHTSFGGGGGFFTGQHLSGNGNGGMSGFSGNGDVMLSQFDDGKSFEPKMKNTTERVYVPSSEHVAEIVGKQGCKIKSLRAKTNTYIKTPVRGEPPCFVVTGRKEDVAAAKSEIEAAAEHFSQIRINRKASTGSNSSTGGGGGADAATSRPEGGCSSGRGGRNMPLSPPARGPTTNGSLPRNGAPAVGPQAPVASALTPPGAGADGARSTPFNQHHVKTYGIPLPPAQAAYGAMPPTAVVNPTHMTCSAPVVNPDNTISLSVPVPYKVVGLVVGPKGSTIKNIQNLTNTYILTPSRENDPVFEITGSYDGVQKAKMMIEEHIWQRTQHLAANGSPGAVMSPQLGYDFNYQSRSHPSSARSRGPPPFPVPGQQQLGLPHGPQHQARGKAGKPTIGDGGCYRQRSFGSGFGSNDADGSDGAGGNDVDGMCHMAATISLQTNGAGANSGSCLDSNSSSKSGGGGERVQSSDGDFGAREDPPAGLQRRFHSDPLDLSRPVDDQSDGAIGCNGGDASACIQCGAARPGGSCACPVCGCPAM